MTNAEQIDALIDGISDLPSSPYPLPELFKALREADVDLDPVVDMISFDPALTAKLLKTCNSAYFGRSEAINDVREAVNRLGFQTVYKVVAAVRGNQVLGPMKKTYGINAGDMWKHSVTSAFAGQFIAEDFGADAGLFFTAGLLHDMGKVILDQTFKEGYGQTVATAARNGTRLADLETTNYGMNHAEVGARLLHRWKFSPEMVACLQFHHNPAAAGTSERSAAFLSLASALAHFIDEGNNLPATSRADLETTLKLLGLTDEVLTRYSDRLKENLAFVETMSRLGG